MKRKCGPWCAPLLLLLLLVLSAAAAAAAAAVASPVSALFILGDSSVNCGDNTFLRFLFRDDGGSGGDPSHFHSCLGSHAHLVPDLLAEKMGLPKIPPFYAGNGTIEGLMSGLNFGSSKATILNTPANGSGSGIGFQALNQQLRQAIETFQILQLQLGHQNAGHLIQSSVFYLSLGKDDYINLFFLDHHRHSSSGVVRQKHGSPSFPRILVNQITQAIKDLYNANARKIICVGIGPLGCAPRSLWEAYDSSAAKISAGDNYCVKEINDAILEYNAILSQRLYNLSLELLDAQIIFCDAYQGMMEIITRPALYGFSNVNKACCGFGPYGGMVGCLSNAMSCDAPSAHVWWDLYQPTDALNSLLADWAWTGHPFNICQPMSIGDVCSANNKVKDQDLF